MSVVVSVEKEGVKLVSVTGDVVVEEGSVVGLLNGFVGFDSTVGLAVGFVMAEVVKTPTDDKGPVFSVVVVAACTGFDVVVVVVVVVVILVGFGLAIVVNGFEVVGCLTMVDGLTFCVGLVGVVNL